MSEQQIFAKCAWRLIPFMALLYLVNFIDRTNVGFAALTMNQDLGFSPEIFGFGAGIFFISYAVLQVPANLIFERVGARRSVFFMLAAWGLISASNALVQGPASFYVMRFLLGVAEAGFYPGMLLYLTYWFPRAYLSRFTAYFITSSPLAFVIGGPLSGLILKMDGMIGLHGWQWLFLIEGVPAFLLAFAALKLLPDGPARATWLTTEEKQIVTARIAAETPPGRSDLWSALRDLRLIALSVANLVYQSCFYGIVLWLPQMVQAMGFSNLVTGFVVALPFMASAVAMILGGRSSSMRNERIWHVAFPWLVAAASFATASMAQSSSIMLAAIAVGLIGIYTAYGAFFSLPSSFLRGTAAAAGIGVFGMFGNAGGFLGPSLVGVLRAGSGDYATGLGAVALGFVLAAVIVLTVGRALALPPSLAPIAKVS
jgi:MFS transporter, ACS family, tartrate transporter